jgi:hypothetical protein
MRCPVRTRPGRSTSCPSDPGRRYKRGGELAFAVGSSHHGARSSKKTLSSRLWTSERFFYVARLPAAGPKADLCAVAAARAPARDGRGHGTSFETFDWAGASRRTDSIWACRAYLAPACGSRRVPRALLAALTREIAAATAGNASKVV